MSHCILKQWETVRQPKESYTVKFVATLIADVEVDDDDYDGSHHHEK